MTTKELLYIEDALGHEKYFQTHCKTLVNQLQDQELKGYANQLLEKHSQIFQKLYGLL